MVSAMKKLAELDVEPTVEERNLLSVGKGDYYRYLAEFKMGDERKEAVDQSMKAYQSATTTAEAELSPKFYHCFVIGMAAYE
ncbi:14-3-3 protein, partial [Corchorus capsularis]